MSNYKQFVERSEIERQIRRLKDARFKYGVVAMNALTVEAFERAERQAERLSEKIWRLEEELEGRA
jgi:hypothetical protein